MALPSYKDIIELVKKGATVEAQEQIMALREAALAIQEESIELKTKVRDLEEKLAERGAISFENGVYWLNESNKRVGPFCQRCKDAEGKMIRLHSREMIVNGKWGPGARCRQCQASYPGLHISEA